jgi:hypothetical protein
VTNTTRRGACVLALVLLFLATGIGILPTPGTGAQDLQLRLESKPAQAETPSDGVDYSEESLSVRTRHKTH